MRLHGIDGHSLELHIVGYQFPDLTKDHWDSNWLRIEGRVSHPRGRWIFQDPCLLTYEVSKLADWLEAVAREKSTREEIDFIEPNLSFRILRSPEPAVLRVYFELEARPRWAAAPYAGTKDLWVEVPVQEFHLRDAARSLRKELAIYPERATR
jgi:hypothetical protein